MQTPSPRHGFRAWCGHNLLAGAFVGLFAGVLNFAAIFGDETSSARAFAGIPLSAAAGGVILLFVGIATAPLMMTRRGRWLGALVHGIATALLAAALLTSVMLRVTTGGYVTLGAIEFGMAAERHVMGVALGPFLGWTIGLFAGSLGVLIGAMWLALRRWEHPAHFRLARAAVVGTPSALIIGALPPLALDGLSATSPELALIASFDESAQVMMPGPGPQAMSSSSRPVTVELGPPLADAERWRKAVQGASGERPNVLVLTLESVAVRHLGYAGYPRETTPNLDRIAESSLRMRRAWTTATHSNYAQMAIISSLFPRRGSGLDVYQRVDYPRALLHDVFTELGYQTATISSQDENWQGMRRFQETGTPTYYWHSPDYGGVHIDTGAELVVPDAETVDHAKSFIARQEGRRWAMYMNLQVTHFPYKLPPDAEQPFQPTGPIRGDFSYVHWTPQDRDVVVNRYDNALRYVDEQVGRMARHLEELGELENTLWVITSDHGELFGEHDLVTHGRTLFDNEARVPLLVHWPKRVRSADVYEPVSHIDILPTILDLMGVPAHPAFQGRSFVAPRSPHEQATGVYLNIQGLKSSDGLVCWPWKLVADRTARRVSLYNLEQDPEERDDRAGRDVRVASDMFRVLRAQMVAQVQYHKAKSTDRTKRYAPRMLACPSLPGTRRADVEPPRQSTVRTNQSTPASAPAAALGDGPRKN